MPETIPDQLFGGLKVGRGCCRECRGLFSHVVNNLVCNWNNSNRLIGVGRDLKEQLIPNPRWGQGHLPLHQLLCWMSFSSIWCLNQHISGDCLTNLPLITTVTTPQTPTPKTSSLVTDVYLNPLLPPQTPTDQGWKGCSGPCCQIFPSRNTGCLSPALLWEVTAKLLVNVTGKIREWQQIVPTRGSSSLDLTRRELAERVYPQGRWGNAGRSIKFPWGSRFHSWWHKMQLEREKN